MFHRLGHFAASYPWLICLAWLAVGIGMALVAPRWDTRAQDDDISFVPERFTSVRAYHLLQKAFPQDVFASRVVFALEREDGPLTDADFLVVDELVKDLDALREDAPELKFVKVDSHQDGIVGTRLISTDRQCTLVQASLDSPFMAFNTVYAVDRAEAVARKRLVQAAIPGLALYVTGAAGIGRDMNKACGEGLDGTTWATVLLVIVVLLCVYRAPLLALVPLLTIAVSVWVALNGLALLTLIPGVHLVNISKIFAIVILYGAGTDYCLFLVSRYREELQAGHRVHAALTRGVGGVGEALAASAGTVMVGLGLMACAEFAKVRYAGPAIAVSLGVALVAPAQAAGQARVLADAPADAGERRHPAHERARPGPVGLDQSLRRPTPQACLVRRGSAIAAPGHRRPARSTQLPRHRRPAVQRRKHPRAGGDPAALHCR